MFRKIPADISAAAHQLHNSIREDKEFLSHQHAQLILSMLKNVTDGQLLAPDDWSLVQETLPPHHLCAEFFVKHHDHISRQRAVNGKKQMAVPIITFTHHGETYVLLMRNEALIYFDKISEIQWTAHGTRVDEKEFDLLADREHWDLYGKLSGGNENMAYLIAAAVRRVRELGLTISPQEIANIHPIDRDAAGFPDISPEYRTEYFSINLGERNPADISVFCNKSLTRFGRWTSCFSLAELKAKIETRNGSLQLAFHDYTLPVRTSTWFFVQALQLLKEIEIKPDLIKDPWQLRNINSIELALGWVLRRMDANIQLTLFFKDVNRLTSAQIHAYAEKAKMNEENLGYLSVKPARLFLHALIAHLTLLVKFNDSKELGEIVDSIYDKLLEQHSAQLQAWEHSFLAMRDSLTALASTYLDLPEDKLQSLSAEAKKDIQRIKSLLAVIRTTELSARHKSVYHLHETDLEIATTICLHEKFQAKLKPEIDAIVTNTIKQSINAGKLRALKQYDSTERRCFGISGPVASGKSVSETMVRQMLEGKDAAYIGSDEWNVILSKCLKLDPSYIMHRGKLTLAEAWFIKVKIWEIVREMEMKSCAPNWIQETCDPCGVKIQAAQHTVVLINTANPNKAAERVKERGDRSGRYVSASVATGSYRWPWLNMLSLLEKIKKDAMNIREVKIIDTDAMYAKEYATQPQHKRSAHATIATFGNGVLDIHCMHRFLSFVERGYQVNAYPNNPRETWAPGNPHYNWKTLKELDKLFKPQLDLRVQYEGVLLSRDGLLALAEKTYHASFVVKKQLMLFKEKVATRVEEKVPGFVAKM